MIDELGGERVPTIDLAHADLAGGEQRPEQHGRGVRRWQHGLRLDPALELLMQTFDRIGRASASPLAWRQTGEGEEPIAGFLEAIGDGTVPEPTGTVNARTPARRIEPQLTGRLSAVGDLVRMKTKPLRSGP